MGAVEKGYSDGRLRPVMTILGGVYLEIHWELDLLTKRSQMCG